MSAVGLLSILLTFAILTPVKSIWLPSVDETVHQYQPCLFEHVADESFSNILFQSIQTNLRQQGLDDTSFSRFQWTSSTAFQAASKEQNGTWLIFGGFTQPTQKNSSLYPFVTELVGVVGCFFVMEPAAKFAIRLHSCEPIELRAVMNDGVGETKRDTNRATLLGFSLDSLQLNSVNKGAVLVYCDPLWREDKIHPGGICRIKLYRDTQVEKTKMIDSIRFCSGSAHSTPCGGGYSIDLMENEDMSNGAPKIDLLIGMPYTQTNGEVRVADDLLRNGNRVSNGPVHRRFVGDEIDFGKKVVWTPKLHTQTGVSATHVKEERLALISSPSASVITAYRRVTGSSSEVAFRIYPSPNRTTFGNGFGIAVITMPLNIDRQGSVSAYAIIIGAPFETSTEGGVNAGAVYIVCPEDEPTGGNLIPSVLTGQTAWGYFGYSLVQVGDVDGDGLEDVAISAPGIQNPHEVDMTSSSSFGQVYIHRITPECKIDPKPLQILQAPTPYTGDGFGVSMTSGVDFDDDGLPELAVTSSKEGSTPYLFTMPRRLLAQCHIVISPIHSLIAFQAGFKIPITFRVRLLDPRSKQWVKLPEGIVDSKARVHQINPDVLWQAHHNGKAIRSPIEDAIEDFFTSIVDGSMDPKQPRFHLINDSIEVMVSPNDPQQLLVKAILQTMYAHHTLDLTTVPLKVAYRSLIDVEFCDSTGKENHVCGKAQQPLVDWSQCVEELKLAKPICVPAPECQADLVVQRTAPQLNLVEWGTVADKHQKVLISVTNSGPTKAAGVRIQVRTTGRIASEVPKGLQVYIMNASILDAPQQYNSTENEISFKWSKRWTARLADDGLAALIMSKTKDWIYQNETIFMELSVYLGVGIDASSPADEWLQDSGHLDRVLPRILTPGLSIRVLSTTGDPVAENDELFYTYRLVYRPKVNIGTALQPISVIDNRKDSLSYKKASRKRRLFADDIGPKLTHTFLVENNGNGDLSNITFTLGIPVSLDENTPLVYLAAKVKRLSQEKKDDFEWEQTLPVLIGSDGSKLNTCSLTAGQINPLNVTIFDIKRDERNYLPERRIKRNSGADIHISRLDDALDAPDLTVKSGTFMRSTRSRTQLRCPPPSEAALRSNSSQPYPIHCLYFRCHVNELRNHDTVRLQWTGWLWADTFFQLHISDVQLVSRLDLQNWGDVPRTIRMYERLKNITSMEDDIAQVEFPLSNPSFEMSQSILFRNVEVKLSHKVPWWPIILGIVLGVIVLSIMGICCYCCGFFRRRRHTDISHPKPGHGKPFLTRSDSQLKLLSEEARNGNQKAPVLKANSSELGSGQNGLNSKHDMSAHLDFMTPASPNLYCAEEPEPPSPTIGPSSQTWYTGRDESLASGENSPLLSQSNELDAFHSATHSTLTAPDSVLSPTPESAFESLKDTEEDPETPSQYSTGVSNTATDPTLSAYHSLH